VVRIFREFTKCAWRCDIHIRWLGAAAMVPPTHLIKIQDGNPGREGGRERAFYACRPPFLLDLPDCGNRVNTSTLGPYSGRTDGNLRLSFL
jgi:hypothetical protein